MLAGLTASAAPSTSVLHSDIQDVIRANYLSPDGDTRYLDGAADLNGDGQPEIIVHVVGDAACDAGGCPTLVFTHLASGYRLLSTITRSNPPIRVSASRSKGWQNLIVRLGSAGTEARDVELAFDGRTYPVDPTARGGRIKDANGRGSRQVVGVARSFALMKPFPTAVP
jgi:hypothetical protein